METENRGDLIINGSGASNGGEFNRVVINGSGTVNSDILCNDFECNGSGAVKGSLHSKTTAKMSGSAKVTGSVNSQMFTVEGSGKIENNVMAKRLNVSGSTSIGGDLKSEEVRVKGRLKVGGDCEAEDFTGECQFLIGGLLNSEHVNVRIFGECRAQEIGGQTITITQKASFIAQLLKPFFQNKLETDLVEGDQIEIENTNAKIVRGNDVSIGPNCRVGLVEYTGTYHKDETAIVETMRKM